MDKVDFLEKKIEELTIQGATNIALATLEGIVIASKNSKTGDKKEFFKYLLSVARRLAYARPTEPLAQNAVRFIFAKKNQTVEYYLSRVDEYKTLISGAKKKMAEYGRQLIQNGGAYLTHCHSSTVTSMFRQAFRQGKRFSVFATETRPKFQGRITAKELLEEGLEDVTLIIDDVAISLLEGRLKHIDAVFIGADLLSQKGFVNKVGSLGIAYAAKWANVPFYCLSILLKYDPRLFSPEMIEIRGSEEIWQNPPKGLKIYTPAFDFIPYDTGVKIVSEGGVMGGGKVANFTQSQYPFLKKIVSS